MNVTQRWANEFKRHLECARCRTKENLIIYEYDYMDFHPIFPENYSIEALRLLVERLDVWCATCTPRNTRRIFSEARMIRKAEAARLADIAVGSIDSSLYDRYVLENGSELTKKDFLERVKDRPCARCGIHYPPFVNECHRLTPGSKPETMVTKPYTMRRLVEEIEKCAILCANCDRLVEKGYNMLPLRPVVLDENFYRSISLPKEVGSLTT